MRAVLASLVCTLGATATATRTRHPGRYWEGVKTVYAFGDSYTFVQGARGHANYSFIGDELNFSFTKSELLTNTIIPKNTSSGGSGWLEFLTGCYEGSPFLCKKQLWDFAFAGADIDANLLPLHHDYTISLVRQVEQFLTYAVPVLPKQRSEKTLIAWWIGINDTNDVINNKTITDWPAFWEAEMDSLFGAVAKVDAAIRPGAHLFLNVPPGDRAPGSLGNPTSIELHKARTNEYNAALASRAAAFQQGTRSRILQFDAHEWFGWALDNAESLGFKNVTGFCQCDDFSYFWLNSGHPTEPVHRYLAEAIDKQLSEL
ncbi:hypothetical protein BKA62DRAFT_74533 [Auriculariales sp. MPI-PUGE-AT-0066]|nr:hypothetical protein BKA62DRAFT_74533 [Auriculariales sp. MPI-PUGE-AT-0066]